MPSGSGYPTLPEFKGIPPEYQHAQWVSDPAYQGGGYYSGTGLGQHYNYAQLEKLWLDAGGTMKEAPYMASIAENTESGGDAGDWNSTGATGLWQIEWPLNYKGARQDLFTPLIQAQQAVRMYNQSGYSPWGSDPRTNEHIPPASSVPNENKAVLGGKQGSPSGNGGGNQQGQTTSFNPASLLLGGILGGTDWQSTLERLGLIVLGGILVLVGIWMLAGKQTLKATIKTAFPEESAVAGAAAKKQSSDSKDASDAAHS